MLGNFGQGRVLALGDYFDSYTSVVTLHNESVGFDALMGNVMAYVPEPLSCGLLALGGLVVCRRRKG